MVLLEPRKKSQVTPPGINLGTVRLVVQRLNHYATPGPMLRGGAMKKIPSDTTGYPGTVRIVVQCLNHYATPGPRNVAVAASRSAANSITDTTSPVLYSLALDVMRECAVV